MWWRRLPRSDWRGLDGDEVQVGGELLEIDGVAGDDGLNGALGADRNVRIDDVGSMGASEHESNGGGVGSIEVNKIGSRLADEARDQSLPGGIANRLGESGGRDRNAETEFLSARDEGEDSAVFAIESNQTAGIEGNPIHAVWCLRAGIFF